MTSTRISIQTYDSGSDNGEGTVHPGCYCTPILGALKMSSVSPHEPAISRRSDQSIRGPTQIQCQHLLPAPDSQYPPPPFILSLSSCGDTYLAIGSAYAVVTTPSHSPPISQPNPHPAPSTMFRATIIEPLQDLCCRHWDSDVEICSLSQAHLMQLAITGPDYSPYSPPRACEWHGWCISTYFCVVGLTTVYNVALCTCCRCVLQAPAPLL